jgi:hypothetical protein
MRTIALLALILASGCITSRQIVRVDSEPRGAAIGVECDGTRRSSGHTPGMVALSRRAHGCSLTLTRPGYEPRTISFERVTAPVNRQAIRSGLLIGGLSAVGAALSGGTPRQRAEAIGSGLALAGLFALGDEINGARNHFEPEEIDVKLDGGSRF